MAESLSQYLSEEQLQAMGPVGEGLLVPPTQSQVIESSPSDLAHVSPRSPARVSGTIQQVSESQEIELIPVGRSSGVFDDVVQLQNLRKMSSGNSAELEKSVWGFETQSTIGDSSLNIESSYTGTHVSESQSTMDTQETLPMETQNWTQLQDREQQQTAPPLTQLNLGVTKTDSQDSVYEAETQQSNISETQRSDPLGTPDTLPFSVSPVKTLIADRPTRSTSTPEHSPLPHHPSDRSDTPTPEKPHNVSAVADQLSTGQLVIEMQSNPAVKRILNLEDIDARSNIVPSSTDTTISLNATDRSSQTQPQCSTRLYPQVPNIRDSLSSQDTVTSQPSQHRPRKPNGSVRMITPDGKVIRCSYVNIHVYNSAGNAVYCNEGPQISPQSSQSSMGYQADVSSSATASSQSQPSQELILKKHCSAEDVLFVSPRIPLEKKASSAPPKSEPNKSPSLQSKARKRKRTLLKLKRTLPKLKSQALEFPSIQADDNVTPLGLSNISSINPTPDTGAAVENVDTAEADTQDASEPEIKKIKRSGSKENITPSRGSKNLSGSRNTTKKRVRRKPRLYNKSRSTLHLPEPDQSLSPMRPSKDLPVPSVGEFAAGARVVACWPTDNHYYTGKIISKHNSAKWQVAFDDGNKIYVRAKDILVVSKIPRGHSVLAKADEEILDYQPALIKHAHEDGFLYEIQFTDDQTESQVASVDICLNKAQFESLKFRVEAQRSTSNDSESQSQEMSFMPSTNNNQPSTSTPTPYKRPGPTKETAAVSKALQFGVSATTSCSVYRGRVFMVTCLKRDKLVDRVMDRATIQDASDTETDNTQTETDMARVVDRDQICAKIEALGGVVIDEYDVDTVAEATHSYLISAAFQRTVKYLQCLAANIPPVSYQWVEQCYRMNQLIPIQDYLLPAGVQIHNGQVLEWALRGTSKPFKDKIILIGADNKSNFHSHWKSIFLIAGAHLVPRASANSGIHPDYMLVSPDSCPKHLLNHARRSQVHLVTPEWAVQSLITSYLLPSDGHPEFMPSFLSTESNL